MGRSSYAKRATLHPIRWMEQYAIDIALHPETTPHFHDYLTVRWAARVRPGLRVSTLRRAFEKLVKRHEPLRQRFVETDDGWKAEILDTHPVGLIVETHGALSDHEQVSIVTERVREPLDALSDALFEMRLLRFGDSCDVVFMRANHAIIDGYSAAMLVEELLKYILSLPVTAPVLSYGEFVGHQVRKELENAEEKAAFWRRMLLPPPTDLNIGRKARGLAPMSPATVRKPRSLDRVLEPDDTARIEELSKRTGATPFAILQAAFSETLCTLGDADSVMINGIYGRNDPALSTYVGPGIEIAPLRYDRDESGLETCIAQVVEKLSSAAKHLPTRELHPDGQIIRAFEDAGVKHDRFWVLAPLPVGRMRASPFRKLFEKVLSGPLELGAVSIEQLEIPSLAPTDVEIEFTITPAPDGPRATIHADAAAYGEDELGMIADGVREQLARAAPL
ncbi:condensation domain-containing protein [Marivita geojedonensis]|uniref:Condensation domain-containing protein n=2 Tax=Marivita geojedonensis TaxID=1123756 RepID=A0A1X4NIX6_9RHOB|nr:condensation domain-containing protein [Marivita geojedonensis]OSQ48991.1 hypothetical protein MGEO_14300 [Marivita geojedonensis]PRY75315.1 condensation domain-containing protein [Marivita geojedonensis]